MRFSFNKVVVSFLFIFLFVNFGFAQSEREKGFDFYQKGDYKAAAEILQKIVENDENDGEAWRFLGMAYARSNDEKQARKAFGKAVNFTEKDLNKIYDSPVKIISKRHAQFTEEARQNLVSGTIKLAVEFGANGKINFIFPLTGLSHGLTENTVKAASEIKFEPAIKNRKAVTVIKFMEYHFTFH